MVFEELLHFFGPGVCSAKWQSWPWSCRNRLFGMEGKRSELVFYWMNLRVALEGGRKVLFEVEMKQPSLGNEAACGDHIFC